jgi:hypothetical protein
MVICSAWYSFSSGLLKVFILLLLMSPLLSVSRISFGELHICSAEE